MEMVAAVEGMAEGCGGGGGGEGGGEGGDGGSGRGDGEGEKFTVGEAQSTRFIHGATSGGKRGTAPNKNRQRDYNAFHTALAAKARAARYSSCRCLLP